MNPEDAADPVGSGVRRVPPRWHAAAALIFLLAAGVLAVTFHGVAYDDAYITYRYARNLAEGHGFSYNPGTPSLGTTTPLLTLALAGLASLGADIPVAGSLLSCFSLLLLAAVLYLCLVDDGRPLAGIVAGLLVLVNFRLALTIGGESVLLCLLVVAAGYLSEVRGRPVPAAILLALAALTRGEGVLAAPVLLALHIRRRRRFPWAAALAYGVVLGTWFVYSWWTMGVLAPSTLSAKMAQGRSGLFFGFWAQFWIWAGRTVRMNWLWILLLIPAAAGLRRTVRGRGGGTGRVMRAFLFWVVLYLAGYTLLGVAGYHWYSVPVIVAVLCLAAMGLPLDTVPSTAERGRPGGAWYSGRGAALAALIFTAAFLFFEGRGVRLYRKLPTLYTTLYPLTAERLNRLAGPDESAAYLEIGVIGYRFHGRMLDLLGLTGDIDHDQIAKGNLLWGLMKMEPDWYLDMKQFDFMTGFAVEEPWFPRVYRLVETVVHPKYPNNRMRIYRRNSDVPMPPPLALGIIQDCGEEAVGGAVDDQGDRRPGGAGKTIRSVGQSFRCERDGLRRIDVKLATDDGFPKVGGALFRLRADGPAGKELARVRIPGGWHFGKRRHFPVRLKRPLPLEGRMVYFSIETTGENRGDAPPPSFLASSRDVLRGGTLHLDGQPVAGDLVFRTWHQARQQPKRR